MTEGWEAMQKLRVLTVILCGLVLAFAAIVAGCGGDDDDDDSDDDSTSDDDDDDDDVGTTPVIDTLNPYYSGDTDGAYVGDPVNMNFHFTDGDANLMGGSIHFAVGGTDAGSVEITYDPGTDGYITTAATVTETWPVGPTELEVYIVDAAGEESNTLSADIRILAENTAPSISNLRFDPDPACTDAEAIFEILFDYYDPDANLDGGTVVISFDLGIPQPGLLPAGLGTDGTFGIQAWPTAEVPEGTTAEVSIQISDQQNAMSELLDETLTFSSAGCSR